MTDDIGQDRPDQSPAAFLLVKDVGIIAGTNSPKPFSGT